jgi:sugar/nucleoside kinase (ribokinase family)
MIKSVLGAGLVAVDHIFKSSTKRGTGKTQTYLGSTGGGSVSNTLCMLPLLGHKAFIFGIVGNDYPERIVSMDFARFDVDYSTLVSRGSLGSLRGTRQFSHVIYPDGEHSFRQECLRCHHPFTRQFQMTKADLSEKIKQIAGKVDLLHIDRANEATGELAAITAKNKHMVSFDVGFESYGSYQKRVSSVLELATLVKITEPVFEKHIGARNKDGIRLWWKKYPDNKYLLVTRGGKGVYGFAEMDGDKKVFSLDAIPCEHLRDSAGAGDILTAVAIHTLLLTHPPTSENELCTKLNLGQALASLSCTLYGARSLQFLFLNQGLSPQQIMEWADKILKTGKSGNSLFPLIGLRDRDRFNNPSRLAPFRVCSVCGSPLSGRPLSRAKTKTYAGRVSLEFVPLTLVNGFFVGKASRCVISNIVSAPMIFVGSGGSLSASVFGEQLVLRMLGKTAKALPPFDFEGIENLQKDTVVWLLSYGGANPDIMGAAIKAAKMELRNCIVLTGARDSKLTRFAKDHSWTRIFLQAEERGFVSTIGMLAMISALTGLLVPDNKIDEVTGFFSGENLYRLARNADRISMGVAANFSNKIDSTHIIALGSGWGWPAMIDFESKIVEGGICTIEISEMKNFTHGRYINALYHRQNRHFVLFDSPLESELVAFFAKKLKRYFPQRLDVLRTDLPDVRGSLDLIVQSMFLAFRLGGKSGLNLLKPRYPPEARGLYDWAPSSRREEISESLS